MDESPEISFALLSTLSDSAGIHVISEVMKAASYPSQDLTRDMTDPSTGEEHKKQVAAWCASLLMLLTVNADTVRITGGVQEEITLLR